MAKSINALEHASKGKVSRPGIHSKTKTSTQEV